MKLSDGEADRRRDQLDGRAAELFAAIPEGFVPRFITPGREILITWEPGDPVADWLSCVLKD